jgi:hypothetical protein
MIGSREVEVNSSKFNGTLVVMVRQSSHLLGVDSSETSHCGFD